MNSLLIAAVSAILYLVAYNTYGRFLARKIFKIDPTTKCPSETHHDGIDFVKTNKLVLFGHHFTSIAGTGPIVGPAIPMVFMIAMTAWAMKINLISFYTQKEILLFVIGSIISVLQIWMVVEGVIVLARLRKKA